MKGAMMKGMMMKGMMQMMMKGMGKGMGMGMGMGKGKSFKGGGKGESGKGNFDRETGKGGNTKKLFVGGLPKEPNEQSIRDYFSMYGTVTEVKMLLDSQGYSKGYCFVTFDSMEASKMVLDNYEHNIIDGRWVDVKPSDPGGGAKPGDWYCPMCGDLVFAKKSSCSMCGYTGAGIPASASPGRGGKPGDWVCPSCNDLVFSYRDKCNKCGAEKQDNVQRIGTKPGDWSCPHCGDLVFGSKSHCKMCGTAKPDDEGDAGSYGSGGAYVHSSRSSPY